jgi:hypothetical protein
MSDFTALAQKSNNNFVALVELDILNLNVQWINIGAGIWCVNFDNIYSWVDASLLDGFSAQAFGDIGSVLAGSVFLNKVLTLAEVSLADATFYYDSASKTLYVCLANYDDPHIRSVFIGEVNGFTKDNFIPLNANSIYENRISNFPNISFSRDPMFYGKLSFGEASFGIINADGNYDTFGEDNDIYGNPARVKIGFKELDIDDYQTIHTGFIGSSSISEGDVSFSIVDRRKQLSKSVYYSCISKNALTAIEEILYDNYGIAYNSASYKTTTWDVVKASAPSITISYTSSPIDTISLIEEICKSIFGIFIVESDGKFNFKVVDYTTTVTSSITNTDILFPHTITYDPSQIISSTRIGYNRNWSVSDSDAAYTWLTDTSQEEAVFNKYKTYVQVTYKTLLTSLVDAQAFSDSIIAYSKDVHGVDSITVPIKHNNIQLGDLISVEIKRETTEMLGVTKKCEVLSKTYDLETEKINLSIRIIGDL